MNKDFYRNVVVDSIMGLDQESWTDVLVTPRRDGSVAREHVTWYRDEEPFNPMIKEMDIREMAENIKSTPPNCYCAFQIYQMLHWAVKKTADVYKQFGTELRFDNDDYLIMKDDMIMRLNKRFQKYTDGKRIETKEFADGVYGFRFV